MIKNQVLQDSYQPSTNFFKSDLILQEYLSGNLSAVGFAYMHDFLELVGGKAATIMDEYSMNADKESPVLVKRDRLGRDIDEIKFHPHYWELMKIAVESRMMHVKWNENTRPRFQEEIHTLGFSAGYIYGMSELGQFCPLCMTDGVARLIDRFCTPEDKARLLPKIATLNAEDFFTGAMFLTEKAGGSDVGANLVKAIPIKDDLYELQGEKWFCSNVNADIIFVLARTDEKIQGTRGLSIFMVEKQLPDGTKNPLNIVRIKDKLGVKSMASGECMLQGTVGKLIGEEFKGFQIMTEMINLSRLYNSMAALSGTRRGLIEAYQFLCHRTSFKKRTIEHALVREKLHELGSIFVADFYITWRTVKALDAADNGAEKEKEIVRILTPMIKKCTAANSVYSVRECMELMGGLGYIEDTVMPKIMRDVMVLPIWEGAGNIMTLDMLRAAFKSKGLEVMLSEVWEASTKVDKELSANIQNKVAFIKKEFQQLGTYENDTMESAWKYLSEELTNLYKLSLLILNKQDTNMKWVDPAIDYYNNLIFPKPFKAQKPVDVATIHDLIGWEMTETTSNSEVASVEINK